MTLCNAYQQCILQRFQLCNLHDIFIFFPYQITLQSSDYGKHLRAVEGLLERHGLIEVQVKSQGNQINQILQVAESYVQSKHRESKIIRKRTAMLTNLHQEWVVLLLQDMISWVWFQYVICQDQFFFSSISCSLHWLCWKSNVSQV